MPQSCGANCHSPVHENEVFLCKKCCETIGGVFDNKFTISERENIQRAQTGYHVFYVALAVEYVTKHHGSTRNITQAVISYLDGCGRTCTPCAGPKEPDISIEQLVRQI